MLVYNFGDCNLKLNVLLNNVICKPYSIVIICLIHLLLITFPVQVINFSPYSNTVLTILN